MQERRRDFVYYAVVAMVALSVLLIIASVVLARRGHTTPPAEPRPTGSGS